MRLGGTLREAVIRLLKKVEVFYRDFLSEDDDIETDAGAVVPWRRLDEIIEAAGGILKELTCETTWMTMKMEKALVDSSCVSRLSSSEVAVEKLNICSISHRPLANAILEAVGGSVKSLAIREFPFELIPTCATGLQELKVMGGGYSRVEEDEFRAQIWETGDMWEAVGPTLEVFVCYIQGIPKVPLEKMKMFCRKLQSISVCPHFYAMNALTDLLVSCGERLRFTDVDALSAGDLQIVLSACPNMQANYDGNQQEWSWAVIALSESALLLLIFLMYKIWLMQASVAMPKHWDSSHGMVPTGSVV